jgi:hypothetical protein
VSTISGDQAAVRLSADQAARHAKRWLVGQLAGSRRGPVYGAPSVALLFLILCPEWLPLGTIIAMFPFLMTRDMCIQFFTKKMPRR